MRLLNLIDFDTSARQKHTFAENPEIAYLIRLCSCGLGGHYKALLLTQWIFLNVGCRAIDEILPVLLGR